MKNPWNRARAQLLKNAQLINLNPILVRQLYKPEKVIRCNLRFEMDDGSLKTFKGYRVQHNSTLGPYKGGLRYHPDMSLDEIKALAFWMTMKNALVGVPFGGGKGGIVVDPKNLSIKELEKLTRIFTQKLSGNIGPDKDIPAPDVNTNSDIMAWIVDEYAKTTGRNHPAVVTGKPLDIGGSMGRKEATGLGGVYILLEILKRMKRDPVSIRVAVQGFGNVGYYAARYLSEAGCKIIAVSDSKNAIYSSSGLDPVKALYVKQHTGSLLNFCDHKSVKPINNSILLELDIDVLIPSAIENVITKDNARDIKAGIILELANGPTTSTADVILAKNNRIVIPDILANAGGVVVSYFEWHQNLHGSKWSEEQVFSKLKQKMIKAADDVLSEHKRMSLTLRDAAYSRALKNIQEHWYKSTSLNQKEFKSPIYIAKSAV